MGLTNPPLRLDLIADFRAWSKGMGLTELVMRKRSHPRFAGLTLAELKEARRQVEVEAEASLEDVRQLAAQVADLIVQRTIRGADHGA